MGQPVQLGTRRGLRPRMDTDAASKEKVPVPAVGGVPLLPTLLPALLPALLWLVQQISFVGIVHGLQASMHLEFVQNVVDMVLDRLRRNREPLRDFLVG